VKIELTRRIAMSAALALVVVLPQTAAYAQAPAPGPATPKELVDTYDALADTILASHKTERKLVLSILAATYAQAQGGVMSAAGALKAGDITSAKTAVQNVAAAVGQIATEGDNSVAGIRKRLLEGGHHANSEGEAQGIYEEGYVIVTKAAKKTFLDSSQAIAMLAQKPTSEGLFTEWKKVQDAWNQHIASVK
jgi:hypothetical protein